MSASADRVRLAYPVVVAAVLFSSLSALLIRLNSAPPLAIAAGRMLFSSLMVVPIVAVRARTVRTGAPIRSFGQSRQPRTPDAESPAPAAPAPPVRSPAPGPAGLQSRGRTLLLVLLAGVLLALHFATWISSLSLTSVTHATVLVTMHPLVVLIINALMLRELSDRRRLLGAVGAVAGALVLSLGGSAAGREPSLQGNLLAFSGAVAIAGYLVIGGRVRRHMDAWSYSLRVYSVSAVVLLGIALVARVSLLGHPMRDLVLVLLLAFFCTILGHGLINWGLRYVPAVDVSMLILLEPVFATLMAIAVLGEIPGPLSALGAVVVIASLMLVSRRPA